VQLERAPQEDVLQAHFEAVKQKSLALGHLRVRSDNHLEQARRHTWQAIDTIRKLRKLEADLQQQEKSSQALKLADATRTVLADFSTEVTKRKIHKLEEEFVQTFTRLARKEDAITRASIDPETFSVSLYDKQGRYLSKKDLSAGEKQIYAVAMLDALARTSGRKLPLIIDTPLGRLDSMHRSNLVSNYFPHASHQVIVLSTDTEIDHTFYSGLSKNVSHAYHLVYDQEEGSSSAREGFFWKLDTEQERYAS
jgi:DNA sulfur modification protein DndD